MTSPPLITANITKNASNVPIIICFLKCFRYNKSFCSKNIECGSITVAEVSGLRSKQKFH